MKTKTVKKALLSSVFALVVCVSMLLGTTFAWFTDSVTSSGNIIQSGTLKVAMYWAEGSEDPASEQTVWEDASSGAIFNHTNWEPGFSQARHVRITNDGTLGFKYQVRIVTHEEVSALAEVIDVYYFKDATQLTEDSAEVGERLGTLVEVLENKELINGRLAANSSSAFSLVFKMRESAGNEYQGLTVGEFLVQIVATQLADEATIDDALIAEILSKGGVIDLPQNKNIDMYVSIADGISVQMNLNDNAVNNSIVNRGELNVSGGSIVVAAAGLENLGSATLEDVVMHAGSAADYAAIGRAGSETVLNNVDIKSAGGAVGAVGGGKVVFNGGSVDVNSTSTSGRYLFYAEGEGSEITINGGSFDFNKSQNQKRAYVYAGEGTTVYINGGTFGKASTRSGYTDGILGSGTVIITGGTFGFNPTKWLAGGYTAVKDGDNWIVEPIPVDVWDGTADTSWYDPANIQTHYEFSTVEQLAGLGELVSGDTTFAGVTFTLTNDLDLYCEDTSASADGDPVTFRPIGDVSKNGTFEGTFDGNGKTISNIYQNGWDLGYQWGVYGAYGLFGNINNATVKNLTLSGGESKIEGGDVSFVAGSATGTCVFENITIEDSIAATYNNGCGGIIGWSGAGEYTFKNITLAEDVVLGGLWGSFDSSIGGIVGQGEPGATYNFENVNIACRIDAYNDCTASYDHYNYRMCGMIIGRLEETVNIDGTNYPDTSKYNITCTNVTVTYGEWADYHYCDPTPGLNGGRGMRVEPGYSYDGLPEDYDHSQCTAHCKLLIPFDQIFGGAQLGVKGLPAYEGVTVIYNNK